MQLSRDQRILIRGVNWLGDAVMTTPALLRLREARPDAHITLLTPAKLADLWQNHPAINAVLTFGADESPTSIGRRLRVEKYDLGLVLPNSPRSALELWLARIPERVGYARPWRNLFLTETVAARSGEVAMHKRSVSEINALIAGTTKPDALLPAEAHHIYQYLHLVAALGAKPEPLAPKLVVSPEAIGQFASKFQLPSIPLPGPNPVPTHWFGLNAGAEYGPAKRWPEQHFIKTAVEVMNANRCNWLVFGTQAERDLAERITTAINHAAERLVVSFAFPRRPRAVNLAGATSLAELCAGLKFCRVLLTNDSGPMHVAAALGTPVVVPFGSTSPELTGPSLPGEPHHQLLRANAPCSPCFLRECPIDFRCMTGISVEQVVTAVLRAVQ
jgi:lipopolysaccharide heptosyltransferase II